MKKTVKKPKQSVFRVPPSALEIPDDVDYNEMTPVFRFSNADENKWVLHEWQKSELKALIKCFKKMEKLTWKAIRMDAGLQMKKLKNITPPRHISPEVELYEIRVTQEQRIHGYVYHNIFYIVWFDRDHSVCPEGKNRRYGT